MVVNKSTGSTAARAVTRRRCSKNIANDAHLNGDRVNAEYYLQFADHYFRVIADTRVRQEEQRLRRDDRWQEGDSPNDESDDSGEFGVESEFPAFDQPPVYTRREREDRPERPERAPERQDRVQPQADSRRRDERPAYDQQGARANGRSFDSEPVQVTPDEPAAVAQSATASETPSETVTSYEPPENPFLRENRGGRGLRPRREDRRPRREDRPATAASEPPESDRAERAISAGIDPQTLPPSFTVARDEPPVLAKAVVAKAVVPEAVVEAVAEAAPAPTPRRRAKRKPAADDTGEPIKSLI
jgi:hypothetical protein